MTQGKWKVGDIVWWANHQYRFVIRMYVYQVIRIQVDDGAVRVRYRLVTPDSGVMHDVSKIDINDLDRLDDEWPVSDADIFATRDEAYKCLIDGIRKEIVNHRNSADYLEQEIQHIQNRRTNDGD